MKKLLLSLFLAGILFANETIEVNTKTNPSFVLSLDYLKTLPKSLKRDFFINEYLKQNISKEQAYEVLPLISNMQMEIFYNFAKKFGHDETLGVAQCMNMKGEELVNSYADCIVTGLSLKKASLLSSLDLNLIIQKTKEKYPTFTKELKVLSSAIPFTRLVVQNEKIFYDIFLKVDASFREKYFDYKLPKKTLEKITKDKIKFQQFLKIALNNPNLNLLNKSLNGLDDKDLDMESSFYLGLNSVRFKDFNTAYSYFEKAKNKTTNKRFIDKIDFWIYQITKDSTVLENLARSEDLNFYSYFSKELLFDKKPDKFRLSLIDSFNLELKKHGIKKVAFLYCLAKLESDFQKDKVSKNLKAGIFQLDAKTIEPLLKKKNQPYDIFGFFDIQKSLNYVNLYLEDLKIEENTLLKNFFTYENNLETLKRLETKDFFKTDFLTKLLNFESVINNKEDFLLYYVLYYNRLVPNRDKEITLKATFEKL